MAGVDAKKSKKRKAEVREEEPVLRSLARVDLESASELWFGLRAVANGILH